VAGAAFFHEQWPRHDFFANFRISRLADRLFALDTGLAKNYTPSHISAIDGLSVAGSGVTVHGE
jgi:hypothetical protein